MGVQAKTPRGKLAPFEKTRAVAFQTVIGAMEKHLGKSCWQLTGQGQADFTARHLRAQGGGSPSGRAIRKVWAHKAKVDGTTSAKQRGRPPQITQGQRQASPEGHRVEEEADGHHPIKSENQHAQENHEQKDQDAHQR